MGAKARAGLGVLGLRQRGVIRLDVALDVPRAGLEGRARCGTAWASRAFGCSQMRGRDAGRLPALGQRGAGLLSGVGGAQALGWQVQAWFFDGLGCALGGVLQRGLSPLKSRVCLHHQPTLGHAIVAQRQRLIARVVIKRLPGIPRERWANALRNPLDGGGQTGENATLCQLDGLVLTVECGIGAESAWRGWGLEGTPQRRRPLLENLGVCRVASPALAHQGAATLVSHQQCQHRLLQVGTGVRGVAGAQTPGVLVARRARRAGERQAGRLKRLAAQIQAFVRPARKRQCLH